MPLAIKTLRQIEPKISPLVQALNDTKLLTTFSSCQGHFRRADQKKYQDRNFADVRFHLLPGIAEKSLESLLTFVVDESFNFDLPVTVDAYKKYIAVHAYIPKAQHIYIIKITPANRFDRPSVKRKNTDQAIAIVTQLIRQNKKYRALRKRLDAKLLLPEEYELPPGACISKKPLF